jgi:hypothetical protein
VTVSIPVVANGLSVVSIEEQGCAPRFLGISVGLCSKEVKTALLDSTDVVDIKCMKCHAANLVQIVTISYQEGIASLLELIDHTSTVLHDLHSRDCLSQSIIHSVRVDIDQEEDPIFHLVTKLIVPEAYSAMFDVF